MSNLSTLRVALEPTQAAKLVRASLAEQHFRAELAPESHPSRLVLEVRPRQPQIPYTNTIVVGGLQLVFGREPETSQALGVHTQVHCRRTQSRLGLAVLATGGEVLFSFGASLLWLPQQMRRAADQRRQVSEEMEGVVYATLAPHQARQPALRY